MHLNNSQVYTKQVTHQKTEDSNQKNKSTEQYAQKLRKSFTANSQQSTVNSQQSTVNSQVLFRQSSEKIQQAQDGFYQLLENKKAGNENIDQNGTIKRRETITLPDDSSEPKRHPTKVLTESDRLVETNQEKQRQSFANPDQSTINQQNLFQQNENNTETGPNRPTSYFPKNAKRPGLMARVGKKIQSFFSWLYNKICCGSSGNSTEIRLEEPQTKHQKKYPSFGEDKQNTIKYE